MAAPTNTFQSSPSGTAVGVREDLSDIIYNIAPTDVPFLSSLPRVKATSTFHEWQTDNLATAVNNKQLEGDDATYQSIAPTVRLGNYTQISTKAISISGTMEAVLKAGRKSEIAYQLINRGKELKRDMETGLLANTQTNNGSGPAPRQSRGLNGWIGTNYDFGTGGSAPVYTTNPGTAPVAGTGRAFTESLVKTAVVNAFTQGGNPKTLMVTPSHKQTVSTFTGNTTRMTQAKDETLVAAFDVYKSDFGTLKVVPNRFMGTTATTPNRYSAYVIDPEFWALAVLRPMFTTELAKTGDAEKRELITEYALEARQEKASAQIADLL